MYSGYSEEIVSEQPRRPVWRRTRQRMLAGAAAVSVALPAAACGSSAGGGKSAQAGAAGGGSGGGTTATIWLVTTGLRPANDAVQTLVNSFEKSHPGENISISQVENQSFKQKIQLAMGAGN